MGWFEALKQLCDFCSWLQNVSFWNALKQNSLGKVVCDLSSSVVLQDPACFGSVSLLAFEGIAMFPTAVTVGLSYEVKQ